VLRSPPSPSPRGRRTRGPILTLTPYERHYGLIIIGTGAGGGTLPTSSRPPASASADSSAATTCPRKDKWTVSRSGEGNTNEGVWYIGSRSCNPAQNYCRGKPSSTAPRLPACEQDFEISHTGRSPRADHVRRAQPYYTKAEQLYHGTGQPAAIPRSRGRAPLPAPAGQPRAAHPGALHDDLANCGCDRSRATRIMLMSRAPKSRDPLLTCDGYPASSGPSPMHRSCAVDPAPRNIQVTLTTCLAARTYPSGRESPPCTCSATPTETYSAHIVVASLRRDQLAALLLRSANDSTRGARQCSDVVGPTTWPQLTRSCSRSRSSRTRRCSRRRSQERLLLRVRRMGVPDGHISSSEFDPTSWSRRPRSCQG